ncbi:hypothetical protein [Hoeflea sp.]|uniref:hypothetical protein n=1 Tax=Hoeflea sp. TaxID=1940281 RepID=UPI00199FEAAF|nr:hypothetical protein [Hoeflea sp.]MBC7282656.1 hypothetical protein [Hoeflea sp.]
MTDPYLLELKWLSPAAKTRAGEMISGGGKAAATPGMKAPEGELDAFLFEAGRSRGLALMIVDSVATALDDAGDLAPRRPEGAMETGRARTFAERIAMLARLARIGGQVERHAAALKKGALLMRDDRDTLVEHSGCTNPREYYARQDAIAALEAVLEALK